MDITRLKALLDTRNIELAAKRQELDRFELDPDDYIESFRELIDECTETVVILGMSYTPSRVLEELDPIAFGCELSNYVDGIDKSESKYYQALESEIEELESEIEDLENQISNSEQG